MVTLQILDIFINIAFSINQNIASNINYFDFLSYKIARKFFEETKNFQNIVRTHTLVLQILTKYHLSLSTMIKIMHQIELFAVFNRLLRPVVVRSRLLALRRDRVVFISWDPWSTLSTSWWVSSRLAVRSVQSTPSFVLVISWLTVDCDESSVIRRRRSWSSGPVYLSSRRSGCLALSAKIGVSSKKNSSISEVSSWRTLSSSTSFSGGMGCV